MRVVEDTSRTVEANFCWHGCVHVLYTHRLCIYSRRSLPLRSIEYKLCTVMAVIEPSVSIERYMAPYNIAPVRVF